MAEAQTPDGDARTFVAWSPDMGALLTEHGVRFRVWAPEATRVEAALEAPSGTAHLLPLDRQKDGTWTGVARGAAAGWLYHFAIDGAGPFPDPYSRSQPNGVHAASEVVDPSEYHWNDAGWSGLGIKGLTIYQCHVGTATPEGTFDSLIADLDRLAWLGVRAVQLLPVADFPGRWNWGYDGVALFAPARVYGGPAGLKRLVDAAHQRGLGIILDVVYNHLGPDGSYLRQFSPHYFTNRYTTPWGDAINYDDPGSQWVRKLVVDNALYWLREYHADGLRLDATHAIHDSSPVHILRELSDCVHASIPPGRSVVLIAETSENDVRYVQAPPDGFGLDAVWADDFHHSLRRYLAGDSEGYYQDYAGTLEEVARIIQRGWLYEGQQSSFSGEPRGTPTDALPAWHFQWALQNHDQVGNRAFGERLHHPDRSGIDLPRYRAATTLFLLLPYTPLLFMGQEFAASTPFQYFTDHAPELGRLVTAGRRKEFASFSAFASQELSDSIPDPQAESTFLRSKLPRAEIDAEPGAQLQQLYHVLLQMRRTDPALVAQDRTGLSAQAVGTDVVLVQQRVGGQERLIVVNFASDPATVPLPRPLSAPGWKLLLASNETRFGGDGAPPRLDPATARLDLPSRTALFLAIS